MGAISPLNTIPWEDKKGLLPPYLLCLLTPLLSVSFNSAPLQPFANEVNCEPVLELYNFWIHTPERPIKYVYLPEPAAIQTHSRRATMLFIFVYRLCAI